MNWSDSPSAFSFPTLCFSQLTCLPIVLGFVWCLARIFIPAPSGRQRLNVLGALHATTHQLLTVVNHDYINAETVATLLHQLAATFSDLPITLVLDNARYQHCRRVIELAAQLGIELLFLPPYSPNLNLSGYGNS